MRRGRIRGLGDCCVHLTARCHDRQFLLTFQRDRQSYVSCLRETRRRFGIDVLDFMVTSDHVHLLLWAGCPEAISSGMQYLQQGEEQ